MLRSFRSLRAIKSSSLAACLCLAVSGLISPAQQQTASLSKATVHGTVIDSTTKQPIARALVQSGDGDAVLTDSNGNFEFPDVLPGQESLKVETIIVRRPGYITSSQDQQGFQTSQNQTSTFQVSIRADMAPLTLPLTPESLITGRIVSPDSDPEDGIQVTAYRRSIENGRLRWQQAGMGTTNSEGVFRIASLPGGTYILYTQPPADFSFTAPDNGSYSSFPAVYYPGVADASAAATLTLNAGEHKPADITLLRQTFYPVTIRAANAQANYVPNLDITDSAGRPIAAAMRFDPAQEVSRTHLPPGRYFLTARVFGPRSLRGPLFGRTEFTVTAAPAYIGITAVPLRSISVTIHKEFTAPLPQVTFGEGPLGHRQPGVFLNLVDARADFSGGPGAGGLEPVPGSNDDSSWQISNVPPGKYWVEANAYQGYVSSITGGGVDLTRDFLTIGAGGSSAPIEITLRNDTGSIDGTITNTQSAPDAETHHTSVYAIPVFNTTSQLQTVTASSSGKFNFSMLAPGSYRVIASDIPLQIEYHNPEALAALSNKGQVVTVEPGSDAHVQLDIPPPAEPVQ